MIGGRPFLAPLQSIPGGITKAVDVGCGTGIATLQLARLFPSATVHGLDLSPLSDAVRKLAPPNAVWTTGNILDVAEKCASEPSVIDRIFAPESLDYIFGRMLVWGINDWPRYFSTAARALRAGGIIEHQDIDWAVYSEATTEKVDPAPEWHQKVELGMRNARMTPDTGSDAAALMTAAGLEIVSVQTFAWVYSPSPKFPNSDTIARYSQAMLVPQFPVMLRKLLEHSGVTDDERERLGKQSARDISTEGGLGLYHRYTVTVAKRP